ncbi:MAG TPA: hypothetical protein VD997_16800 [Phycisphaerales bacterium]|nr:hypothetical protein [Phycisphaerales bacterium]
MPAHFQWPPRPLPEQELGAPASPRYWKPQPAKEPIAQAIESPASSPSDTSPPEAKPVRTAATAPPEPARPIPARASAPSLLSTAFRHIESTYLGLTRPPFAQRAADANWHPDLPHEYCPRCASTTGVHEATTAGCTRCAHLKLPWDRAVRLARYEGLLQSCIHEVKFSAWKRLGLDLGRELGHQLAPHLEHVDKTRLVLIPIPASWWRRVSRGIDHTTVIAKGVHQVVGGTLAPALRRRHRRPQVGLSNTDRARNAAGSMRLRGHPRFEGCTLVLIDDVRTTGATMGEAAKVLRRGLTRLGQKPAAIWSCTLAVAEFGDRSPPI